MARLKIIYSRDTGKKLVEIQDGRVVWASEEYTEAQEPNAPMVMGDIPAYQSQIDGSMITSRGQHRNHLRQHNCIEIGNETQFLNKPPPKLKSPDGLKEMLIHQAHQKLRYT